MAANDTADARRDEGGEEFVAHFQGVAPRTSIFIHAHQESDIGLLELVARSGWR